MGRIRGKDTKPEMTVRRLLHAMGFRFRLHAKELPGKPDIVFRPRRKAVLVHGCYWHGHGCARGGSGAQSNANYWGPKIAGNRARDLKNSELLAERGWRVLVVWECEVRDEEALAQRMADFLRSA